MGWSANAAGSPIRGFWFPQSGQIAAPNTSLSSVTVSPCSVVSVGQGFSSLCVELCIDRLQFLRDPGVMSTQHAFAALGHLVVIGPLGKWTFFDQSVVSQCIQIRVKAAMRDLRGPVVVEGAFDFKAVLWAFTGQDDQEIALDCPEIHESSACVVVSHWLVAGVVSRHSPPLAQSPDCVVGRCHRCGWPSCFHLFAVRRHSGTATAGS